jgi:hypothetical protein
VNVKSGGRRKWESVFIGKKKKKKKSANEERLGKKATTRQKKKWGRERGKVEIKRGFGL